jgi:GMP synthase-like glutamine amidotransferase
MRVAIVENTAVTHHGQVGVALAEAGVLSDVFRPFADGCLPEAGAHDGLVVLGGEQSALDDAIHPYLPRLAALMRAAEAAGRPVLGICLGAQILARAFGGRNLLGAAPEFGWLPVTLTEAGAADPVLGAVPRDFRSFQWHADSFTLPPGALRLATGAVENQAFRIGRVAWGMQFHFEANRAVVADWTRRFAAQAEALAPGWTGRHAAEAAAHGAAADAAGLALARAWVARL